MFHNPIYSALSSMLPRRLEFGMQRLFAKRLRRQWAEQWPIYEPSGRRPEGWPGWPDKKEFALVLSHDVEGPSGLSRCRQLAEIEMEYGFRSSFNFVPTGDYEVPVELLSWLRASGFEIGVRDMGRRTLFRARQLSADRAQAINRQLNTWSACGIRAIHMARDLNWLHNLGIE